ncbi:MAG: LysM peptidoglycan-binding domain-containing protein [Myxococcales bacterium]|nr:LysM peptidoglycan-binding domain-containing protein [Myxococcales bacterium]
MPNRVQTSPVAPRPLPTTAPPTSVTVQSGDTLGKIAQRMGVSADALVQANVGRYPGLATNRNAIQVGWTLKAPGATPTAPANPTQGSWQPGGSGTTTGTGGVAGTTVRPNDFGNKLAAGGAQSIELRTKKHLDSIEKTGVGTYYGDHSSWKSMDATAKQEWINSNVKPGATAPSAGSIRESSCIGWAMENVGAAYAAAGKTERWSEIMRIVTSKGSKGMDLAKELKKDGWQAIYWNPDAKNPSDGNAEHSFSALQVSRGKGYYGVEIDAQVTNYRPTEGKGTKQDMSGVEKLRDVPFFFGLAKGGMHTFVGRKGEVNEFHWAEMPNSTRAIEQTPLEKFGWNSGLIMVPPGTWPKD